MSPQDAHTTLSVAVIVNGVAATISVEEEKPLRDVIKTGLRDTDQEHGHPMSDWIVKDAAGTPLDLNQKFEDFHFPADVVLHIELRGGGGGSNRHRRGSSQPQR